MADQFEKARELTLVVRSQIGDEAAFAELIGLYSGRLRFFVTRMLHGRDANADDVLQDIWISAFRCLPRLRDTNAFPAWIFRIARDRVAREFRREHWAMHTEIDEADQGTSDQSEEGCDRELVRELLTLLSPPHREALALRFIEEMSYDDIARITGSSVGTVRSRIHYAKRALRRAYEENKK